MALRALVAKPASHRNGLDRTRAFAPRLRQIPAQLRVSEVRPAVPWNFSDVPLFANGEGVRPASAPFVSRPIRSGRQMVSRSHFASRSPQGKCDCGGACKSCQQTKASYTSSLLQVPEDSPVGTEDDDGAAMDLGGSSSTQQDGDGTDRVQGAQDEGNSGGGARQITQGSGGPLCHNGGGSSACDLSSGEYKILSNDNTCCTKDCTQQHEATHVADVTGWGCCKQASAVYTQSASPGKVAGMYNKWLEQARPLTECHAYTNDVKCATAMQKASDCSGKGKDSACCLSILSYKNKYSDMAADYCKVAPAKAPPCPNFALASLLP